MFKKLKYKVIALLLTVVVAITLFLYCSHTSGHKGVMEKTDSTPAMLDSIKSIRQWELLTVETCVDVDSARTRMAGFVHDYIQRRYYGMVSLGLDLSKLKEKWHQESRDTITLEIPDVIILDDNFIDESKTTLIQCDSKSFESDSEVRGKMYEKALALMRQRALADNNRQEARKKAESELSRLFRQIGYKVVNVKFNGGNK